LTDKIDRVGFIGLGDQGEAIAEMILRAGFDLRVWARRPGAAAALGERGAQLCATPGEVGRGSDLVCVCVTADVDVCEVVLERGLLDAMAPEAVLVIHSTISPTTCTELAALAAARAVRFLDAPVSGGRPGASRGALSVMVGGDPAVLARVRPVFEAYAGTVTHLGDVGCGQVAKLVNNGLFVANIAMAVLALELGERFGLRRDALAALLAGSSGTSAGLQALGPLTTTEWGRHAWTVLAKDVDLLASITGDGTRGHELVDFAVSAAEGFSNP
jgi:3-hydroxyisobutyrate dehydrogenase